MENEEMTNDAAVAECPKCGAPCDTFVHMRGGDYGWSTTDLERTDYKYSATTVAELRAEVERLRRINTDLVDKCNRLNLCGAQSDQRAIAAERRVVELLKAVREVQIADSDVRIHEAMNPRSRNYRLPIYEAQRQARERLSALTKESP